MRILVLIVIVIIFNISMNLIIYVIQFLILVYRLETCQFPTPGLLGELSMDGQSNFALYAHHLELLLIHLQSIFDHIFIHLLHNYFLVLFTTRYQTHSICVYKPSLNLPFHDTILSHITEQIYITSDIIRMGIDKLMAGKDDRDICFKTDHIINGTHRLCVLLSLLYNLMFYHGHTPADLLKSTIVSIPGDNKASLSSSDNYGGASLFNSLSKLFDHIMLLKCSNQLQ